MPRTDCWRIRERNGKSHLCTASADEKKDGISKVSKHMNTLEKTTWEAGRKATVKAKTKEGTETRPLMDVAAARDELVCWLAEMKLPPGCQAATWESLIKTFPSKPEEISEMSGVRIRLALPLATKENKYLIAILECLETDSRGNFLISVYVNWKAPERQMQKLVEEGYRGHFDDVLRGRHTLWAQTFRTGELAGALDCCAKAILSNELVSSQGATLDCEKINILSQTAARFPKSEDA